MDFTREPIIETVITPKEGCKLVIRSSKTVGQEEYFVDAVEVVSFGQAIFFRSLERPKSFIVPASDYEVLEVREARIVLKNVGLERSIKIGGGREGAVKPSREAIETPQEKESQPSEVKAEGRVDRKRDRRRQYRKRRGRDESASSTEESTEFSKTGLEEKVDLPIPEKIGTEAEVTEAVAATGSLLSNLLSPPPLISETISRYKEKFKDAFYTTEEQEARLVSEEEEKIPSLSEIALEQPAFGSFEIPEEEEEEIYRQRKKRLFFEEEDDENANEELPLDDKGPTEPSSQPEESSPKES